MRRHSLVLFMIATAWMLGDHPMSAQQKPGDPCPLNLRRGIPEVAQAREAKKRRMRENGVPERYLHLLDKYECIECINTAPDTVHVTVVWKDEFAPRLSTGSIDKVTTVRMLPQVERQLRDDLASGRVESFHVWISEKRCRCCPDDEDKQPEDYDDWDDDIGANMDQADSFDDPSDLPPLPEDLKRAPAGWVPPPSIENFSKPRRRYMHVMCDACQGLADQWNTAAGGLDYLWDRKVSLQRQMNVTANAIGNRNNEINELEYQQQFDTSRSYDRMKQIEALKQVNADQQSDIDREERELAEVEKLIEEQQARMDALMQKVIECEKACKKTTTAQTQTPVTPTTPAAGDPPPPATPASPAAQPPAPTANSAPTSAPAPDPQAPVCANCLSLAQRLANLYRLLHEATADKARAEAAFYQMSSADGQSLMRTRIADLNAQIARWNADIAEVRAELERCSQACGTGVFDAMLTSPDYSDSTALAKCEKCKAAAAEVARLNGALRALNSELDQIQAALATNSMGFSNLRLERGLAETSREPGAAERVAEVDRKIKEQQARNSEDQSRRADVMKKIQQATLDLAAARRALDACNATCHPDPTAIANGNLDTGGFGGPGRNERPRLVVDPINPAVECRECEGIAERLRKEHRRLQEMAQRAFDLQIDSDYADAEVQQKVVAGLVEELALCNKRKPCTPPSTTTANTTASTTGTTPTGTTVTGATPTTATTTGNTPPVAPPAQVGNTPQPATPTTAPSSTPAADPAPMTPAPCPCDKLAADLKALEARQEQARAEFSRAAEANSALGKQLLAEEAAFRDAVRDGKAAEADRLRTRMNDIVAQRGPLQSAADKAYGQMEDLRNSIESMRADLDACRRRCATPTTNNTTNTTATNTAFGPIDQDCLVPGTPCSYAYTPRIGMDWPKLNLNDAMAWGNVLTVTIEVRVQRKGSDVLDPANFPNLAQPLAPINMSVPQPDQQPLPEVVIQPTETPKIGSWFNPLGLLARRLVDHVERWRGSMGPRPLITARDLALVDSVSSAQSLGLPRGVHFLMVDQGGSTGRTITMQVLNLSGKPVRLQSMPFVMEPLQRQAQEQIQKAFSKLSKLAPVRLDLSAYCTEFLKLPPTPNTIMRLAPPEIQKQFEPMSKVLRSAYRIKNAGLLHPDSNPAAYTDSIKQWALWTVEQKLSESRYTEAFIGHTKKNMEGAGQKWSKQAEDVIRQVAPNRWRDIAQILRGAGVPIPQ